MLGACGGGVSRGETTVAEASVEGFGKVGLYQRELTQAVVEDIDIHNGRPGDHK